MGRNQTKADMLLKELKAIKTNTIELEKDIEATRGSVLSSPQWNDMKVSGGIKQSQTDKNVAIIDRCDTQIEQIQKNLKRKSEILKMIYQLEDKEHQNVLLAGYVNCETFDDACDSLKMSKAKYFTIKRKAIEKLNILI
ncbi:hypothetical protein [Streptococcus phage Str-PAP-1]|uniref:DUF1492 domain-containing protein n=1 Tax=Streptococcus phage Str-PAP-1 TaxID=1589270 RepID=UPI000588E1BA|nr:DUF1492 domain-containing protein [Streptococcus phage Str-PAP-1]AJD83109.1 hypothetical protein [Streptococcus phage Str-PAP-1]